MAFKHGTPNSIVTDGLVLCMDPANVLSWSGPDSSTVNNLMDTDTGTIYNDTSGSYGDNNSFEFDGVDNYIDLGTTTDYNTGDLSAFVWIKALSSRSSTVYAFSNSGSPSIPGFDIKVKTNNEIQVSRVTPSQNTASGWLNLGFAEDVWQHLGFTYNESTNILKLFLNGVLRDTSTDTPHTPKTTTKKLSIGSYKGISAFWEGNIGPAQIYNSTLSASEVAQNYNALKNRFRT